jgi:hypothetical protein
VPCASYHAVEYEWARVAQVPKREKLCPGGSEDAIEGKPDHSSSAVTGYKT